MYRELWATIRAGRGWRGRLVNRRKDGSLYTEEQTVTPVTDDAGVVTHFIAVKQDVTEFREVSERLQARDDLFRLLLENALDIITILNADGTIRYESPSVLRILGYEPHELEGRSAFEFMPAEDVQKAIAILDRIRSAPEQTGTLEFRFRHKDGSWRILEAIGRNMLDHPMLTGMLVNSRDVTERRRIEDELASQRAARIQSEKLADMGTLLAGVAHELNNPLTVVTGYSSHPARVAWRRPPTRAPRPDRQRRGAMRTDRAQLPGAGASASAGAAAGPPQSDRSRSRGAARLSAAGRQCRGPPRAGR